MTTRENEHSHSPDCSLSCLEGLLSPRAYVPLARNPGIKTVKDVMMLHQNGGLGSLRNIGELRVREIQAVLASIDTTIEPDIKPSGLYLMLKLQVTSDIQIPETPMFNLVSVSVFHLLDDLYIDSDDGATLHIDVAAEWWLTERLFSHWKN
jgi:hypothetical protein